MPRTILVEMLSRNLGRTDRAIRLAVGGLSIVLALSGWISGLTATGVVIFAWVPLFTGFVGWCPFYTLFGVSTRKR